MVGVVCLLDVPTLTAELEEVIVTAQKKSQDVQDVAGSVGTVLEDVLNEVLDGGVHATALWGRSASLYVENLLTTARHPVRISVVGTWISA